jgi:hypothetical protein
LHLDAWNYVIGRQAEALDRSVDIFEADQRCGGAISPI